MNRTINAFDPLPLGAAVLVTVPTGTIAATVLDSDVLPSGQAIYFVRDSRGRQYPANAEMVRAAA